MNRVSVGASIKGAYTYMCLYMYIMFYLFIYLSFVCYMYSTWTSQTKHKTQKK